MRGRERRDRRGRGEVEGEGGKLLFTGVEGITAVENHHSAILI